MMHKVKSDLILIGVLFGAAVFLGAASPAPSASGRLRAAVGFAPVTATTAEAGWDARDWAIFRKKVAWALGQGLDTVPIGEAMARVGRSFVGTPYAPGTLEAAGPEHLVIDFRAFDCVTFVENTFAIARFLRTPEARRMDDRAAAEARYDRILTRIRYRGGRLEGYPSRLHYFSEWISDGVAKGLVKNMTRALGGVRDTSAIDFMTKHAGAYRQLADTAYVTAIRRVERRLSARGRWYIPQDEIARAAPRIRDGDIIAVTSTVAGLDIAHTGLAIRVDGALHLLNAPLVGSSVQISAKPLAERIQGIRSEDGIMVARPLDPGGTPP